MHWTGSGTYFDDCTGQGDANVAFPGIPYTGSELNAGFLNVVGPGDFHTSIITAFDPAATMTVTCPGDPPTMSEATFEAGFLLYILMEANEEDGPETVYRGDCVMHFGDLTYHFTWNLHNTRPASRQASVGRPRPPPPAQGSPSSSTLGLAVDYWSSGRVGAGAAAGQEAGAQSCARATTHDLPAKSGTRPTAC